MFNAVTMEFQQRQHCEKCHGTGELAATEMSPVGNVSGVVGRGWCGGVSV